MNRSRRRSPREPRLREPKARSAAPAAVRTARQRAGRALRTVLAAHPALPSVLLPLLPVLLLGALLLVLLLVFLHTGRTWALHAFSAVWVATLAALAACGPLRHRSPAPALMTHHATSPRTTPPRTPGPAGAGRTRQEGDGMTARPGELPVTATTTGRLHLPGNEDAPVAADLVYQPWDPLAVTMVLRGPDGRPSAWTFAFDLLAHGLTAPAGGGDVTIRPRPGPDADADADADAGAGAVVEVVLTSVFTARMSFPAAGIGCFVRRVRSRAHLDAGRVATSLDTELTTILRASQDS